MNNINQNYKQWHKPNRLMKADGGTAHTHQGYAKITNVEKYIGDPNLIIYRSSWEAAFIRWCDASPSIIRWSSEPIKVPYYDRVSRLEECQKYGLDPNNPVNWAIKNYNIDFFIEIQKETIEKWFIEIKPAHKLTKPTHLPQNVSIKETRKFNIAAREWLITQAKWAAMKEFAEKRNCKFYVLTEIQLRPLLGRFWDIDN